MDERAGLGTVYASLPSHLRTAYDWTNAAGELDELRTMDNPETYCHESVDNWNTHRTEQDAGNVTVSDLMELRAWLISNTPAEPTPDFGMSSQSQLEAVAEWCNELQAIMRHGLRQGRPGWRNETRDRMLARFHEKVAKLIRSPSARNAASVAAYAFMTAEVARLAELKVINVDYADLEARVLANLGLSRDATQTPGEAAYPIPEPDGSSIGGHAVDIIILDDSIPEPHR